jgi:hypothetical protein
VVGVITGSMRKFLWNHYCVFLSNLTFK